MAAYSDIRKELNRIMESELQKEEDPRMSGNGEIFQNYESINRNVMNYYERRVVQKEDFHPNWVNATDIETDFSD